MKLNLNLKKKNKLPILNEGYDKKNIFEYSDQSYIYKGKKKYIDLSFGAGTLY